MRNEFLPGRLVLSVKVKSANDPMQVSAVDTRARTMSRFIWSIHSAGKQQGTQEVML